MTTQPPESFQLRLNKSAVESLFANDPTARLKLSHDVIEHVIKKVVLAKIETDPTVKAMADAAQNAMQEVARGIVIDARMSANYSPDWQLLEPFKSQVQESVKKAIANVVDEMVRKRVDDAIKTEIANNVQYRVDALVASEVRDRVNRAFKAAVDTVKG